MLHRLMPARNAAARAASFRRISSEATPAWYKNAPHWWNEPRPWGLFAIIVWWWLPGSEERRQLKEINEQLSQIVVLLEVQKLAKNSARGEKRGRLT